MASLIAGAIVVLEEDGSFSNYKYVGYASIAVCFFTFYLIRKIKVADGN